MSSMSSRGLSSACILNGFLLLVILTLPVDVLGIVSEKSGWVEGRILVKPRSGLPGARLGQILSRVNGRVVRTLQQIGTHIVEVPPQAEAAIIQALSNDPHIDYAEKDLLVAVSDFLPNDPRYSSQWHLPKIQAAGAWDASSGEGVTIAIVDTGVEASHPDLVNSLVPGWNVVSNTSNTSPVMGHGTRVAGSAAATGNNAVGVASVAWSANIMPLRITDRSDGWAYWSDMAEAITWATDHGADVANVSYDIGNSYTVSHAAQYMRSRGGVVLTSAGNSNTDHGYSDNPYIIHVAATTGSDAKASFSNYGDEIDVAAPGSGIHTTTTGGGYTSASGTSYASPVAAGVVAVIMAANPRLNPDEVEGILEQSANDLGSAGWDQYFGHGRVNAAAAVLLAQGGSVEDLDPPTVVITSPSTGSTVNGTVAVDVSAEDDIGVQRVELFADEDSVGTDLTSPYEFSWDSTSVAAGSPVALIAYAYDAAGNVGEGRITVTREADTDDDGLSDAFETDIGTDPDLADSDGDGLTDDVEVGFDGDLTAYDPYDPVTNPNGTDLNANRIDTDGDGIDDATEHNNTGGDESIDPGSYPLLADADLVTNGEANAGDYLVATRIALGLKAATIPDLAHGDMNGDGAITLADLILILPLIQAAP
jgi:hypothetical protein